MVGQPRVEHALDARLPLEPRRDRARVLAVALHPDRQRLQPAQDEPRVERAGDGPERLLEEEEPLGDRMVVRRDEPADHVGVAAEVLRRRVDDGVGAEVERVLEVRRRERVVDDEDGTDRVRRVGCRADVDDVQQRVRRGFDPDHAGPLVQPRRQIRELGRRHVVEEVALRLVDLRGHPVDAPVDVRDEDDALSRVDEVHQGRRRAEARGEGGAVLGVLQRRERRLQRRPRRVRDARVVVALVDADRLLHVRRRLVDRRDDRAGRRVRLLTDVDRPGLERRSVFVDHQGRC
jgi:hypothetical protein